MRTLITAWSFPGHINPTMAIALALRERGHEVAFWTGERARATVEGQGFRCFTGSALDEEAVYETCFSPRSRSILTRSDVLRRWLVETIPAQVDDISAALDAFQPELTLCDITVWGPSLILRETRGAQVAICSFAPGCMIPSERLPPWGLGLGIPRTLPQKLAQRAVRSATDMSVARLRRQVNEIRADYGLTPLDVPVHQWLGNLPLYLVPSIRELDYDRRDTPDSVHYVGPVIWNKSSAEQGKPEWFDAIPNDKPWVHVTEGTMHAYEPFLLQAAAEGLANLPMEVVMTTGGRRDPEGERLDGLAPNIHVRQWAPHKLLFEKTNVVVNTGGAGTLLTALEAGIPLLIVPTEWDKPDNAQRVVEAGAGLRLAPERCTPARLREAVERLLNEPSFGDNARRLGEILKRHRGPARAAELLEERFACAAVHGA